MKTEYQRALQSAAKELKSLDEKVHALECQRAKLRQVIAVLQSLLGQPTSKNQTLTDAMIDFVRAKDGYAPTADVMDGLLARGYSVHPRSVATILSKLVREKQFRKGPEGGYKWAGSPTSTGKIDFRPVKSMLRTKAVSDSPSPRIPFRSAKNRS
jgi:hypothetical protein